MDSDVISFHILQEIGRRTGLDLLVFLAFPLPQNPTLSLRLAFYFLIFTQGLFTRAYPDFGWGVSLVISCLKIGYGREDNTICLSIFYLLTLRKEVSQKHSENTMAEDDMYTKDGTMNIHNKPANKKKTGQWKACRFILGNECCERLAYYGMSTNLVNYLQIRLNQGNVTASNQCHKLGMVLLTMTASIKGLRPSCDDNGCDPTKLQSADVPLQKPGGSPLTRICQVLVASTRKYHVKVPNNKSLLYETKDAESNIKGSCKLEHTEKLSSIGILIKIIQSQIFDKAAVEVESDHVKSSNNHGKLCTVTQVEELKSILRLLPVWATGILFSTVYSQMSTMFVLQGNTMDQHMGPNFKIPSASLSLFDTLSVIFWAPVYDRIIVPFARKFTGHERGFTQLQRMGIGLVISIISMIVAGILEVIRLNYKFLPSLDNWSFTMTKRPMPRKNGKMGWIPDNMNRGHLDYFYWLLAILSLLNFLGILGSQNGILTRSKNKGIDDCPQSHSNLLHSTKYVLFHTRRLPNKRSTLSLCKSNDDDSSPSDGSLPEGDSRKQELLARIAMLQAQKVRLTDYLDERSAYLTQFAEEANAEFDQIGENALKELEEAGTRIMENMESQMQAFQESSEMSRLEIENNEKKLADFEGQIEKERNEGLFFKNLRQRTTKEKAEAKEEMEKIRELTKENAGSKIRRNIYLALVAVLVIGIIDNLISPSSDWRKVAVLGAILVALLSQFIYEQRMTTEAERTEKEKTEEENK
ncbi:Protein NRT1/ PTR family 8.2 [Vitis vinifera]|uniref:Protein NRT1/ PTR family 8.2 n=1 Tax=Vitis vinifera TaxID=29760 RepID=A0A438BZ41_VITVI|nr:Protein NRT1/ PTR family 8.2 [Vitis vinifera]